MSEQTLHATRVLGTIRRRLLVNALVDPDEAALRLPVGVRPHVTGQGTVVGICLLEIESIRPAGVPAIFGRRLRAAAHRISSEWEDESGATVTGVSVPVRHTDSRLAVALGGRWFPGVHARSRIDVTASEGRVRWTSDPIDPIGGLGLRVAATIRADAAGPVGDVGATCLGAAIGVSPDHRGVLEAARMEPAHCDACEVAIDELDSEFLRGFATATPAASYLMRDVAVTWSRARAPITFARARA